MLTDKQKLTIQHLKDHQNISEPMDIIKHCINKLSKPRHSSKSGVLAKKRSTSRKHTRKHYQGIISYFADTTNLVTKRSK